MSSSAGAPARRRFPLHAHLSVLFSLVVLATGATLGWLGYAQSRDVALAASDDAFRRIGDEARMSLRAALQPIAGIAELFAVEPIARARTLEARLEALPALKLALGLDAPVAAVYVGYDDGGFFLLRPLRDDAARKLFAAPPGAVYYAQSIDFTDGDTRRVLSLYFDARLNELSRHAPERLDFDPRTRPWYRLAAEPGKRVLTEPYVFYSTQAPGMTVALRSDSGSVVGIDVTLAQMTDRLASLRVWPNMRIALFDEERRVLAFSEASRAIVRRSGDTLAPSTLDELGEPVLARLEPARAGAPEQDVTVDVDGGAWKATVLPIQTVRGTLSLGIAVPLKDLLADARRIRDRGLAATLAVLLAALPLTWWLSRRIARSLARLTAEAQDIRRFRFDGPAAGGSFIREIDHLSGAMDMMRGTIRRFLDIATSLSAETNFSRLLDRVVGETASATGAKAGLVYLVENDGKTLVPAASVRSDEAARGSPAGALAVDADAPVAQAFRTGRTMVATLSREAVGALAESVRERWPAGPIAVVAIPLRDRDRDTVGVLALFAPGGERPSDAQLAFAEVLSGTSAVAIETQRLLEARKALLDAFIQLVAGAIDAKSPYTGGHCQRVPELTLMLARAACDAKEGPLADFDLSDEEWEALAIASWLHDCGKVTTPEYVVDKATKLETLYDRIHEIRMRFEVLKRDAEIGYWKRVAAGEDRDGLGAELERELASLDEEFAFVAKCNEGGEAMDLEHVARLERIAERRWLRTLDDRVGISHEERTRKDRLPAHPLPVSEPLLADKPEHVIHRTDADRLPADNRWGFRLNVPQLKYNRGELYNLSVGRGTLTEEERYVINHHIVQTIVMLSQLPFPRHLASVPEIAGGHHEKMDGSGYPRQLARDEMSWPARMMAIADIFEALTAADRPYKRGKTVSEAIAIMAGMKREHHVDPDLFDLFLTSGVYRTYAERFLQPEQIDAVNVRRYVGAM